MFKLLKELGKKEWILSIICVILVITQVYLELKMPDYMSNITVLVSSENQNIDDYVKDGIVHNVVNLLNIENIRLSGILENGVYMIGCALGGLLLAVFIGLIISYVSAVFSMKVRKKLFDKTQNLAIHEIKKFSTSSLITRTTNDITQIQMLVAMGLHLMIKSPVTAVWAITKILNKNWQWSAITGGAVLILLGMVITLMIIVVPKFKIVQKLIDKINGVTRENLTGIRVVRAFNAEKYQEDKFEDVNTKLTNQQLFNQKVFAVLSPVMYLVMYFLTLAIYFVGAFLISNAGMVEKVTLFGNMVVFSSYAMQVIMSFLMLAMIFMMVPRAGVSATRINEVLETEITIKDGKINTDTTNEKGTVEFKNVFFKYPDGDDYVLKNISFKANKGETVAFIGSTGCGKTSLIDLVPRFYDATSGEVLVDGINVKEYKQSFLRNKIGYVSQKAVIFKETVENNIAYGDNGKEKPDIQKIKKAIEVAQGKDFVEKMENSYKTEMAQRWNKCIWWTKTKIIYCKSNCT